MTKERTYEDIALAYEAIRKVRNAGHGASLIVNPNIVVTFYAPKKFLKKF